MVKEDLKLKMAVISGASKALKYQEMNPRASPAEVIKHVSDNMDEILEKIDVEE
jgi:hypothetical protein